MSTLMQCSQQWASRPSDERFTSLTELLAHTKSVRDHSNSRVQSIRKFEVHPVDDTNDKGLAVVGDLPGTDLALPTHWSFGQLAQRADAPAGYLRKLPNFLVADLMNWGLRNRPVEEVGLLVREDSNLPEPELTAATGPNYGRVWNYDVANAIVKQFGDGVTGRFRVPGEFGKSLKQVTKDNTTLYAGDRNMFIFLADEENRIEIPNRRPGLMGSLARGFFAWNSEVGDQTIGVATFLFDYACQNRMVWGASDFSEVRFRHTSGAPDRFIEEIKPALIQMANGSTHNITEAIENARRARIDNVDEFLLKRFTKHQTQAIKLVHETEEGKPIESIWDAVTGVTAFARGIEWQDQRVDLEREAGKMLKKVS